ncbi:MAG: DNA gyrase inhibitor YacG [Pseudomonadota bacterium]
MKSPDARAVNDNRGKEKCPICKAPADAPYNPFCSKRCADVDLHRWLSEGYAIPSVEADDDGEGAAEES